MSCNGCMYMIGKDATCNQSYTCNTSGDRPTAEEANRRKEQVKKENKKSK